MASIFFRTGVIFILLSVSMKLMGKRQIGELEVSELISTFLISEICSIPIDDPDIPLLNAIIPVLLIVSAEIILSSIKNKSQKLKKIIDGKEIFLIKDGKLNQQELRKNRISIEEFLSVIRQNGAGSLSDIEHCILEANGKISIIKKGNQLDRILISDGEIINAALKEFGISEGALENILHNIPSEEVFLMTRTSSGDSIIIRKEKEK